MVFERVFPNLVNALVQKSEESLVASRDAALIFLYRLLFVLYAEDRGLLPVNDERYDDYGLRKPVAMTLRAGWRLTTRTRRLPPIITIT